MKELRYVFFNLGPDGISTARHIVARTGLEAVAKVATDGVLAGSGSVTLSSRDPRLPRLLAELAEAGEAPLVRAERKYTERELAEFEWLNLRVATVRVDGGYTLNQPLDRSSACPTCGSGAKPIPPLLVDVQKMGKKLLDRTRHDGHVVATSGLAAALVEANLTGLEVLPVRTPRERDCNPAYRWLNMAAEWGPLSPVSVLKVDGLCPTCQRSGHFDEYARVTELWYDQPPSVMADFSRTREYFGTSYTYTSEIATGGAQQIIVSQRARAVLKQLRVHRIRFEPIWFLSRHTPRHAV